MDAAASVAPVTVQARAKINLALHVIGQRADGYHELDSLVVFAREGDRLDIAPSSTDRLELTGDFGHRLPAGSDNIVLKALNAARTVLDAAGHRLPPQAVRLTKNLPPSSGIGGGSADAAALLRLFAERQPSCAKDLRIAALSLGADVPMCMDGANARVRGIGELSTALLITAPIFVLLVNPRVEVPTPAVFSALLRRDNEPLPDLPDEGFAVPSALADYLRLCRNDLMPPAVALEPVIGEALEAVERSDPLLARMSGSGATVFGLFGSENGCRLAAERIAARHPGWWVRATAISTEASHV
ncbi:4-(cytidine 5'-diphospho)-2-C-methyl-D-erythritol kinase [Aureimonas sp. AU4]|uniref:4-(cytidine 5'-diphospho)-2-C-methyl-D-erythritol kinase n=1 Tax=Aureimonas sp. AU4 TaxID=1638163 RepID=UPI0007802DFC|nr:4-(cytidine 5'-diphospho)-2-C-methyl-D-erythritol kinase [Aureimonas sp. AU4]